MEKQIDEILKQVEQGDLCSEFAKKEIMDLIEKNKHSFGIVRWRDNEYEDVVCVDKETAEQYAKKYNELAGFEKCFVDKDIYIVLKEI